jgi:hypothetical protein
MRQAINTLQLHERSCDIFTLTPQFKEVLNEKAARYFIGRGIVSLPCDAGICSSRAEVFQHP